MTQNEMKDIIDAVGVAFIVVSGTAVTQFFAGDGTVVDTDPVFQGDSKPPLPYYVAYYALALIVLVTLVLRFLVGSHAQLTTKYAAPASMSFTAFLTDVSFLMFFGAFLVGAALSKTVRLFMLWLWLLSAAGAGWALIALCRGDSERGLLRWWLGINLAQFVLTFLLFLWCSNTAQAKKAARWALVVAGVAYMIAFRFDFQRILGY